QGETKELLRYLCVFPLALAVVDHSLAVLGVSDLLPGTKALVSSWFLDWHLGYAEFFPPRSKKLGNVVYGIVLRSGGDFPPLWLRPVRALVFILVGEMRRLAR